MLTTGERLKQLRMDTNLTLSDLEQKSGIAKATLSGIETGRITLNDNYISKLDRIFSTIGVDFKSIIDQTKLRRRRVFIPMR